MPNAVCGIRKNFIWIRICESGTPNYGSGFKRSINNGTVRIRQDLHPTVTSVFLWPLKKYIVK
jgi:hypothetical protein